MCVVDWLCYELSVVIILASGAIVLQLCDGIAVARLLNATMVLPKFEVAAYWNESRYWSHLEGNEGFYCCCYVVHFCSKSNHVLIEMLCQWFCRCI